MTPLPTRSARLPKYARLAPRPATLTTGNRGNPVVSRRPLLCAGATLAVLMACRAGQIPPLSPTLAEAQAQQTTASEWHLTFHFSGGFAGFDRELEIRSSGEVNARDRRRKLDIAGKASPEDLAELTARVTALKSGTTSRVPACADCLNYQIRVDVGGQKLNLDLNDLSVAGSDAEPLVKSLVRLLDRTLTSQLEGQRK